MLEEKPESISLSFDEIDRLLELGYREVRTYLLLRKIDALGQDYTVEELANILKVSQTTIYRSFWKLKQKKLLDTRQVIVIRNTVDFFD